MELHKSKPDKLFKKDNKMKVGDLVYPFFEKDNNTIGLLLGKKRSATGRVFMQILIHGKVYSVPTHQIREIK